MPEHSKEPWTAELGSPCEGKCDDDCRQNSGLTDADGDGILWACSCCDGVHARQADLERIAANSRALAGVPDPERLVRAVRTAMTRKGNRDEGWSVVGLRAILADLQKALYDVEHLPFEGRARTYTEVSDA
jgi:hypothetical protein